MSIKGEVVSENIGKPELHEMQELRGANVGRRRFLRIAGAVGAGMVGAPALLAACGGDDEALPASPSGPVATDTATPDATSPAGELNKKFGWSIADNVPFFEQSMTRWMQKELDGTDYSLDTQSQDGNAVKAQQIMEAMLADKFAFIAKADGNPPEPYEALAATAREQGTLFQNHSVQAITGAGQNILFDHAVAGENIGNAAVEWAKANGISKPIIGVLGNLADPEGVKRTSVAVETVRAAFPDAEIAGEVEAYQDTQGGADGAGNLLAANPEMNMLLTFNSVGGLGGLQAATEAGKTDPTTFFIGMADSEPASQDLIAAGDSVVQANWGALFEVSAVLMIRDALKFANGEAIPPTRALGGLLLRTADDVKSYRSIADDPTSDAAVEAYSDPNLVRYSEVELKTGQSINDVE